MGRPFPHEICDESERSDGDLVQARLLVRGDCWRDVRGEVIDALGAVADGSTADEDGLAEWIQELDSHGWPAYEVLLHSNNRDAIEAWGGSLGYCDDLAHAASEAADVAYREDVRGMLRNEDEDVSWGDDEEDDEDEDEDDGPSGNDGRGGWGDLTSAKPRPAIAGDEDPARHFLAGYLDVARFTVEADEARRLPRLQNRRTCGRSGTGARRTGAPRGEGPATPGQWNACGSRPGGHCTSWNGQRLRPRNGRCRCLRVELLLRLRVGQLLRLESQTAHAAHSPDAPRGPSPRATCG